MVSVDVLDRSENRVVRPHGAIHEDRNRERDCHDHSSEHAEEENAHKRDEGQGELRFADTA